MKCVPTASFEVDSDALPLLKVLVPRKAELSKNCTMPVAVDVAMEVMSVRSLMGGAGCRSISCRNRFVQRLRDRARDTAAVVVGTFVGGGD